MTQRGSYTYLLLERDKGNVEIDTSNVTYIIDGGYLLRRVVWGSNETFNEIFDKDIHHLPTFWLPSYYSIQCL